MKPAGPGNKLGVVLLIASGIVAVALFPVASLHGPYCTVHGPLTDTLPEQSVGFFKLLLFSCAMVSALFCSGPRPAALATIARSSHPQNLSEKDFNAVSVTCRRRC
jgi:hypothetical protein